METSTKEDEEIVDWKSRNDYNNAISGLLSDLSYEEGADEAIALIEKLAKLSRLGSFFLPTLLTEGLKCEPSVSSEVILLRRVSQPAFRVLPEYLFYGLLFIYVIVSLVRFDRQQMVKRIISVSLMILTGIIGVVILCFWIFIGRDIYASNYNLFWALPTNLLLAYAAIRNKGEFGWLFRFHLITVSTFLVVMAWLPQAINISVVPLLILLLVIYLNSILQATHRKRLFEHNPV